MYLLCAFCRLTKAWTSNQPDSIVYVFTNVNIQTLTKLGEFHPVYCEDFVCVEEISSNLWVAAVLDGCTMGQDSHFASTLGGKIIHKVCVEIGYEIFKSHVELNVLGETFLEKFRVSYREIVGKLLLQMT